MRHHSSISPFGKTHDGRLVSVISLDNGVISCKILTYGATLQSLCVPDRNGDPVDVVLGYNTLQEYMNNDGYLGAVVGRYANRIGGARFTLNGKEYPLAANDGSNHLHGGCVGFSHRIWDPVSCTVDSVTLALNSPDGEEGYPGNLQVKVTYTIQDKTLSIHYHAETDAETPCNLTNHSYFNLSGHNSGSVLDHTIQLFAEYYTPNDPESIPIGIVESVEGTPMDLRKPVRISDHINDAFPQLLLGHGYDHNYVIDGTADTIRAAAIASSPKTGITMQVHTTQPGVQLYTANFLAKGRPGKGKAVYGPRHAFCLETQHFPDSPNQPNFPSATLSPEHPYDHSVSFIFT